MCCFGCSSHKSIKPLPHCDGELSITSLEEWQFRPSFGDKLALILPSCITKMDFATCQNYNKKVLHQKGTRCVARGPDYN